MLIPLDVVFTSYLLNFFALLEISESVFPYCVMDLKIRPVKLSKWDLKWMGYSGNVSCDSKDSTERRRINPEITYITISFFNQRLPFVDVKALLLI